jgi:hypothetical protein
MARTWQPEEKAALRSLVEQGLSDEQAGEILGRSADSVRTMRHRLTIEDDADVRPSFQDLFMDLRDKPRKLDWLCNKYNRSPKHITTVLEQMTEEGYAVIRTKGHSSILTGTRPQVEFPDVSIADMQGDIVRFAVYSDPHNGGRHAQTNNLNKFMKHCHDNEGIQLFFNPGDTFAGIYGYKGQEYDLMPECTPLSRPLAHYATNRQVEVAEHNIPQWDDTIQYMLGGNHDWWHVKNTGIDALRKLCDRRSDMVYLGYDACDVPLTDKTTLVLWHPSGGVSYARSYKLQRKGQEPQAMQELRNAIREERSPNIRMIISGHDHSVCLLPDLPVPAVMAGCFEGQTNYLTQKGLVPAIGGWIFELVVNDAGDIARFKSEWIPFHETHDDYKEWHIPVVEELSFEAEELEVLYEIKGEQFEPELE